MRLDFDVLRNLIREALLNAYDVLGVRSNASDVEIKAAWKKLALQNHPDRGGSHGKMVDINNAKDRLLDKTALFRFGPNIKGYELPGSNVKEPAKEQPKATSNPSAGPSDGYRDRQDRDDQERARQRHKQGSDPHNDPYRWYYFENTTPGHSKFWQCQLKNNNTEVHVKWGRIGTEGLSRVKKFGAYWEARDWMKNTIRSKLSMGYVKTTPPSAGTGGTSANAAPPPRQTPNAGAPPPPPAASGKQYKVYGRINGKAPGGTERMGFWPHTRVKGQAYAPTGNLRGRSKFHQNDHVNVSIDGNKAKVSGKVKNYTSGYYTTGNGGVETDHTQEWDPITQEAVHRIIDEAVADYLIERIKR